MIEKRDLKRDIVTGRIDYMGENIWVGKDNIKLPEGKYVVTGQSCFCGATILEVVGGSIPASCVQVIF